MLQIKAFEVGPFAVNTYLLWDEQTKQAAIIDPSFGSEGVLRYVETEGMILEYVINTHGHVDHVFGDAYFKAVKRPDGSSPQFLIHEGDLPLLRGLVRQALNFGFRAEPAPEPDGFLVDGASITIGSEALTVLHTPGHSPGGVSLHNDGSVLVGDTLFAGSIGRTDFPGSSHEQLLNSVRTKLFVLPDETKVYPGHGPATTIGFEKTNNPFFAGRNASGLWLP